MRTINLYGAISTTVTVLFSSIASSDDSIQGVSYVSGDLPLISISDVNRQAELWGSCAAAYDIASGIYEGILKQPAQAKRMSELANGAEVAVAMSFVVDGVNDINEDDLEAASRTFKANWDYGKVAMEALPETSHTMMMADAERLKLKDGGINEFIANIFTTVKVCLENVDGQRMYIDTWRDFARSGLLTPEK